jgi:Tfp pilus assembly protein PilF
MFVRTLLLAAGLAVAGSASAQSLGRPAEFYFDADPNTVKPIVVVRETGDAAAQKLLKRMERDPQAKAEVAQLAHIAMESGRTDLGRDLYARALARIHRSDGLWRAVMWNYAWDLYRAGDAAGAFAQWQALQAARSVTASWMPPTPAMALWKVGRQDEAVQWYAAAVRSEPQQWATPAAYAKLLPEWRENERATLAEVQVAWAANPPSWP